MRKITARIIKGIIQLETFVALLCLALAIILNTVEIVRRVLFGASFIWIQEVSTFLLLWFTLLGICSIIYTHKDMVVTVFIERFPAKVRAVLSVVILLVMILMLAYVLEHTMTLYMAQINAVSTAAGIPMRYRNVSLLICFGTLILVYLDQLVVLLVDHNQQKEKKAW
jgi:TRAP-type C4-dicarboxylate transport system permease small subunit